jgi:hypothetical protein
MILKKSPSGSLCPYYYMGGELHPLKYGSFFEDKTRLFDIIRAEEAFILKSSGMNNRRIWVDLYETVIDDEVADVLSKHFKNIEHKIRKLCLVGLSSSDRRKISKKIKAENIIIAGQIQFFDDPEEAKQWLIRE